MAAGGRGIEELKRTLVSTAAAVKDTGHNVYKKITSHLPLFWRYSSSGVSELRVVLLGGDWSQRNLVRTLILGGKDFTTQPNSFIKITGSVKNRKISVINTPDLQFPSVKEITEFIRKCAAASDPGPHVFLLVLQPESFTEEDKNRIHQVLYHFNDQSFDHSLVMILNPRQESSGLMEECMKNPPLQDLIIECRYRYLFQMMVKPQELLIQFDEIVKENNGEHVSYEEPEETEETPGGLAAAADGEDEDEVSAFRIVLLGENENKKAELVNQVIRNQELVIRKPSSQCVAYCGKLRGKPVTMVTFPDLFSLTEKEMRAELKSCRDLCHPGPNVLLLLLNPSDFTEEKKENLDSIFKAFDGKALKHSMVITTDKNDKTDSALNSFMTQRQYEDRQYNMADNNHQNLKRKIEDVVNRDPGASLIPKEDGAESKRDETLKHSNSALVGRRGEEKMFESDQTEDKLQTQTDRLRIVLIGKTGSGKSSSGNTILGRKEFRAEASPDSVTKNCQKAECDVDGHHVVVVDTPGLFDTDSSSDQVNEDLKECFTLVSPGPHVFLLVLPIGRLSIEDRETLKRIQKVLGENYKKFTIVLFTKGDELKRMSIEYYIVFGCDEACKNLIRDCGGRYHLFNNHERNNRSQVSDLIKKINIMVKENEGSCYTRETFSSHSKHPSINPSIHPLIPPSTRLKDSYRALRHNEDGWMDESIHPSSSSYPGRVVGSAASEGRPSLPSPVSSSSSRNPKAFPGHQRDIVPVRRKRLTMRSRRHPDQMPEPPQLAPLDVKEQWLYFESLLDD